MLNPIILMLYNTTKKTWHPIVLSEKPFPGGNKPEHGARYKSEMHHTTGYTNRDTAVESISNEDFMENMKKSAVGEISIRLEEDVEWDGQDIPAMSVMVAK